MSFATRSAEFTELAHSCGGKPDHDGIAVAHQYVIRRPAPIHLASLSKRRYDEVRRPHRDLERNGRTATSHREQTRSDEHEDRSTGREQNPGDVDRSAASGQQREDVPGETLHQHKSAEHAEDRDLQEARQPPAEGDHQGSGDDDGHKIVHPALLEMPERLVKRVHEHQPERRGHKNLLPGIHTRGAHGVVRRPDVRKTTATITN